MKTRMQKPQFATTRKRLNLSLQHKPRLCNKTRFLKEAN